MTFKQLTLLFFFSISISASAQILNVESLRKVTDTSGFTGSASLDFSLKRDVNDYYSLSSNIHIQYKMKRHLVLLKNDIEFQKIEGYSFENSGISHLRYNYKFHPRITWEVFGQGQYNKVSKIDFRFLTGAGPRFKLSGHDKFRLYLGTLVMYEHEELDDEITPVQRDFRGTCYLSLSYYPTKRVTLVSTTYYQPMLSKFSDYRIASQSSLLIEIFKNFSFITTYSFNYDAFPAVGIPNSQYDLSSGIVYLFG